MSEVPFSSSLPVSGFRDGSAAFVTGSTSSVWCPTKRMYRPFGYLRIVGWYDERDCRSLKPIIFMSRLCGALAAACDAGEAGAADAAGATGALGDWQLPRMPAPTAPTPKAPTPTSISRRLSVVAFLSDVVGSRVWSSIPFPLYVLGPGRP